MTFNASDPTLDQTLTKDQWDFGDGSKGQGRTASHQYRDIDSYTVTLTVTDVAGLKVLVLEHGYGGLVGCSDSQFHLLTGGTRYR